MSTFSTMGPMQSILAQGLERVRRTRRPEEDEREREQELLRTPGFNPNLESSVPEYNDTLEPLTRSLERIMPEDRSDRSQQIYEEYLEAIDKRPDPSAWRTAAAIGTSFLRPLREGGIPQMLATSPEEREWSQNMSLLEQRMANEQELAKEGIVQRGNVGKATAQYGADVLKPQLTTASSLNPRTGERTQVLKEGEMDTSNGRAGVVNRGRFAYDPDDVYVGPDGEVTMPYAPSVADGNVVTPSASGGSVSTAPAKTLEEEMGLEKVVETGASDERQERTRGEYDVSQEGVRAEGAVAAARERARASGAPKPPDPAKLSQAVRSFGSDAARLRKQFEENRGSWDYNEVQDAIRGLASTYDTQVQALQATNPGMNLGVDFQQIFEQAFVEDGWDWGKDPDLDSAKLLTAFDQAVEQAKASLVGSSGVAPGPAAGDPATEVPTIIEIDGVSYTQEQVEAAAASENMSVEEFLKLLEE